MWEKIKRLENSEEVTLRKWLAQKRKMHMDNQQNWRTAAGNWDTCPFKSSFHKKGDWNLPLAPICVNKLKGRLQFSPPLIVWHYLVYIADAVLPDLHPGALQPSLRYKTTPCNGCCSYYATRQRKDGQRCNTTAKLIPFELMEALRRKASIPAVAVSFLPFSPEQGRTMA